MCQSTYLNKFPRDEKPSHLLVTCSSNFFSLLLYILMNIRVTVTIDGLASQLITATVNERHSACNCSLRALLPTFYRARSRGVTHSSLCSVTYITNTFQSPTSSLISSHALRQTNQNDNQIIHDYTTCFTAVNNEYACSCV